MPVGHTEVPLIRVLIERTDGSVSMPQPGRVYRVSWDGGAAWVWGPLEVAAARGSQWQVGAFRDANAAAAEASRLADAVGDVAEVDRATSDDGMVRVRIRWPGIEPQDPAAELERLGFPDAFAVDGSARVRITGTGGLLEHAGEVVLDPQGDWPTVVGDRSYRGRFRLRVSGSDLLVVNQLNLESYLRGVLPAEMGPAQFPQLEALKAQAVAARTYAVAHLGDHDDEGYDLCATPACQVYYGVGVEHRLSDRAVEETAGLIAVYGGQPIDAMYTSTCGGHTEDAGLLFPDRAQPYLTAVACAWERPLMLQGVAAGEIFDGEAAFRQHLASRILGPSEGPVTPQQVVDRVASRCGGSSVRLDPGPSVARFADAVLAAAGIEDSEVLVGRAGAERLVALADLFDVPLEPPVPDGWELGWHLQAALAVLELHGVVTRDRGEAVPHPEGVAIFPSRAAASVPLPNPVPLYWRWSQRYGSARALEAAPGTTLERVLDGDRVVALVVVQSGGGGEADRRSAWRSWSRERSFRELAEALEIPDLTRIEVTRRGRSGRVVGLRAEGASGIRRDFEGFPIRRSLDIPENLFTFHVLTRPDGSRVVRFLGRGWGHGVGLCQNGSYGLARAGRNFDEILATYYQGITLERWDWSGVHDNHGRQ
jgi:stage II sporulation protein D